MAPKSDRTWLLIATLFVGVAVCVLVGASAIFRLLTVKYEPAEPPVKFGIDDPAIAKLEKLIDKEITLDKLPAATTSSQPPEEKGSAGRAGAGNRIYVLPGDGTVGTLEIGYPHQSGYWDTTWEYIGPAKGEIRIPPGGLLRLKIRSNEAKLSVLSSFPPDSIDVLEYRGPSATAELVQAIGRLKRLKYLLIFNSNFAGGDLSPWRNLKHLELISFEKSSIEEKDLASIAGLASLKELYLNSTHTNGTSLCDFSNIANLRALDLQHTTCGDQTMHCLQKSPSLSFLNLTSTLITSRGLQFLDKLNRLDILSLQGTQIDNEGLIYLQKLRSLNALDLSDTQVGGGLSRLSALSSLRRLHLNRTKTDDSDLKALACLHQLIDLRLESTKITDAAVIELARLTHLRELHLPASISEAKAAQLFAKLPACRIDRQLPGQ
jgi:hypothetical protein